MRRHPTATCSLSAEGLVGRQVAKMRACGGERTGGGGGGLGADVRCGLHGRGKVWSVFWVFLNWSVMLAAAYETRVRAGLNGMNNAAVVGN